MFEYMKKFLHTCFLQINLFLVVIIPIIMLYQIIIFPISEEVWCGQKECRTTEEHIIYNREEFRGPEQLRNKQNLEVYEVRDKNFPVTQYFLRTHSSVYNPVREMHQDEDHLIFSTGYFVKRNAERDLNILKNNTNIRLTKKNTALITFLCICLYIILQSLGIIVVTIKKIVKENESGGYGSGEN